MSDADAHGEETGEVVEGASHDSATLASAFEAAVREDRRDTDLAFEVMQERATEGGLNATGVGAGALPELVGARGEIERMLDYRLEHGSAATRRRVDAKLKQLRAASGARGRREVGELGRSERGTDDEGRREERIVAPPRASRRERGRRVRHVGAATAPRGHRLAGRERGRVRDAAA